MAGYRELQYEGKEEEQQGEDVEHSSVSSSTSGWRRKVESSYSRVRVMQE